MKDKKQYLEFCAEYVKDFKSEKTGREYKVFEPFLGGKQIYIPREYAENAVDIGDNMVIVAEVMVKDGVGFFVYHTRY